MVALERETLNEIKEYAREQLSLGEGNPKAWAKVVATVEAAMANKHAVEVQDRRPGRVQPIPETQHLWDRLDDLAQEFKLASMERKIELMTERGKLSQEIRKLSLEVAKNGQNTGTW